MAVILASHLLTTEGASSCHSLVHRLDVVLEMVWLGIPGVAVGMFASVRPLVAMLRFMAHDVAKIIRVVVAMGEEALVHLCCHGWTEAISALVTGVKVFLGTVLFVLGSHMFGIVKAIGLLIMLEDTGAVVGIGILSATALMAVDEAAEFDRRHALIGDGGGEDGDGDGDRRHFAL